MLKAVYSQFYCGLFVNADEVEKSFKKIGFENLLGDYNLEVNDRAFAEFYKVLEVLG